MGGRSAAVQLRIVGHESGLLVEHFNTGLDAVQHFGGLRAKVGYRDVGRALVNGDLHFEILFE